MRLTTGSMHTLANDLRADDRRDAEARRRISQPTSTLAADRPLTLTSAQRASRGGSIALAGLRRIVAIGHHA